MMRRLQRASIALALALSAIAPAALAHDKSALPPAEEGVFAQITGTSFITSDAEASAAFYVDYLGFKILRDSTTSSEATRGVYGLLGQETVRVILVVPGIWSEEDPWHLGIAFAEGEGEMDMPFPAQTGRLPRSGEPTIGFEVNDLDTIIARMAEDDVPVVVPLALSATGRSRAITVLDPNGMRVQLYQYVEQD